MASQNSPPGPPLRRSLRIKNKREDNHPPLAAPTGVTSRTKVTSTAEVATKASNASDVPKLGSPPTNVSPPHPSTPAPAKAPSPVKANKATTLEIPFAIFEEVVLLQDAERLDVLNAAKRIVQTPEFKSHLKAYIDGFNNAIRLEKIHGAKDPDLVPNPEPLFMALIEFIVSSAPLNGLKFPYVHEIHYGKREDSGVSSSSDSEGSDALADSADSDSAATSASTSPKRAPLAMPPYCVGVVRNGSDPIEYTWEKTVLISRVVIPRVSGWSPSPSPTPISPAKRKMPSTPSSPIIAETKRRKIKLQSLSSSRSGLRSKPPLTSKRPPKYKPLSRYKPKYKPPTKLKSPTKSRLPPKSELPTESPANLGPDPPPSLPRPSMPQPIPEDKELSAQALEVMFTCGNRRHVLGVLVAATTVRFVYYDRAGIIFSSNLDLSDDAPRIAAAFINLSYCSMQQLGFEPCLRIPVPSPSPFGSFVGCRIDVNGRRFVLESLVYSTPALYGRGTIVYIARKFIPRVPSSEPHDPEVPQNVVVKLSWHPATAPLEDELYRVAAEHGVEGIAKLYSSCVADRLSLGIRGFLVDDGYQDRELRIQIMGPVCIPLYSVSDFTQFKNAFKSLIKAHRELFTKANILHRDISANNLMVDPLDHNKGVLIDLDLAVRVRNSDKKPVGELQPPGTITFRSIDLCKDKPRGVYYRHDLESFFYVLAWILTHYDNGKSVLPDQYQRWHEGDMASIADSKMGFIDRATGIEFPSRSRLRNSWIVRLADMFDMGYHTRLEAVTRRRNTGILQSFDEETLGGHVTYDKFMGILEAPDMDDLEESE